MGELEQQNKETVLCFGEVCAGRKLDLLDELVAVDFVRHCQATPWIAVRSRDDFKQFLEHDWDAVPDGRLTATLLVAEGEFVAMFGEYAGKQAGQWGPLPPSGRQFKLDCSGVFRLAGGKIAELWITWDNLALLAQLGYWPQQQPRGEPGVGLPSGTSPDPAP